MNLPYRPSVRLVNNSQPLVDGARHGSLTLKAEPLPVGRNPRGRLCAVTVFFAPISIFAVELGGCDLKVHASDTSVLDKECRHVVVLSELLGSVLDAGRNFKVSSFLEAPQAFEAPVEDPSTFLLDGVFDLRIALLLNQRRKSDDLDTSEEARVSIRHTW